VLPERDPGPSEPHKLPWLGKRKAWHPDWVADTLFDDPHILVEDM